MKKVLIITYYWPPAGGPGVQRVLKFVKYLPQFGWEPVILTVKDGEYPAIDESLERDIPDWIKVYKVKSWEPFSIYKKFSGKKGSIKTDVLNKSKNESFKSKIFRWIRANLFIPDARCGFINAIKKEGKKIIKIEKPDLIFSSSPPHSVQVGAKKLAEESGIKWIADFRDPWTDGFWQKDLPKNKLAKWYDLKLEISVLKKADHIVSVSEPVVSLLNQKYKNIFSVIPNGFDDEDFKYEKNRSENFTITYAGSLRSSQIPYNFFDAVLKLSNSRNLKLKIQFFGSLHTDAIDYINRIGLFGSVNIYDFKSHDLIIKELINSDVLLLLIPNTEKNKGILTGKIFEYLRSGNFILGFGPKDGTASQILTDTNTGKMLSFEEDPKEEILRLYNLWKKGDKLTYPNTNVTNYSRETLTKNLSEIFDGIVQSNN